MVILAVALGVGVPAGAQRPGGEFASVSWLWDWLVVDTSWAREPKSPQQQKGKGVDGHYVAAPNAPIDGGPSAKAPGELDRYQPHQPKSQRTTGPVANGFDVRASRRVPSLATAKSDTFQNPDGSYTRRVYRQPVNYQATDGSWQPIDSTLSLDPGGRPHVAGNPLKLSFAAGNPRRVDADGPPSAEDLVRLTIAPGAELAYSLAGASIAPAQVDRASATYQRVFPDVDLRLGAQPTGVKETFTLRSADVPTEYVYPLRLKGLTPRIGADGSVEFVAASGDVTATMPVGYLEDAAAEASGAGALSHNVRYELVQVAGEPAVKMSIDGAWLRDPKRKFPVVLDPGVNVGTYGDTYGLSTDTSTHSSEDNIAVGSHNGGGERARAFVNFDGFPASLAGKRLDSARLHLFMSYQGNGDGTCVARPFDVRPITSPWNASTMTWASMPGYGGSIGTASPSSSAACNNSARNRTVGAWTSPSLDYTTMLNWALNGGVHGLALTANETDKYAWKRFTSANPDLICPHGRFGNVQCDPFIEVNYLDNAAPQVDARYPANNVALNTLTPELVANGSDPDNWPGRGLRYNFVLYNEQGAQIRESGWVTNGSWKVPPGVLAWGKTYLYAVQVNDYSATGPAAPVPYAFGTQVPQPMVTSSLAQNGGKGFEPSAGNYTTTDIDAQVATVGPALSINRDYNSLDTRSVSAFGRGWSSIVDMSMTEGKDADGALQTATIRYPNGQDVTFGRNHDGSWVPPSGRYSVFKPITGGYSLTDKDATTYEFTQSTGAGGYGLTKITDASQRSVTLRYDSSGRIDQIRSVASNRTLNLTWSVPAGSSHAHVATVTTDPATPGDPATALTWTYSYSADRLETVCPPGTTTACARYEYRSLSQHAMTVLNTGPYSFWRLNEPSGEVAKSTVLSNDGTDHAAYSNVSYGRAGPLPESTSTGAGFNGTSSSVKLPIKPATESSYQSVSMWFKTATPGGVLFSFQRDPVTTGATTSANYNPALYIDNTGKLRGEFWMGNASAALASPAAVTDDQWHHASLVGNGGSQQLFLDGQLVGTLAGAIQVHEANMPQAYIGAGFLGHHWPGHIHTTPTATFFNGSIADVAYYNKPLDAQTVSTLYSSRTTTSAMTKVISNAGRVRAQVGYDTVTGRVAQVTDEHGGVWKVSEPTNSGSSQVYVSSVLGSQPRDYYRFGDIAAPAQASNQVIGSAAFYHNVAFDTGQTGTSPFSDTHGAIFNGTSSYVRMQEGFERTPGEGPQTIEMWFRIPAGHSTSGVLYSQQDEPLGGPALMWTPVLYVGSDGRLRGGYWAGSINPSTSSVPVNDGNWHHVVLTGTASTEQPGTQTLYLDNKIIGTTTGNQRLMFTNYSYIGAGKTEWWPGASGPVSYFKGNITEFAYYDTALSAAQVDAHYKASRSALPPPTGVTGPVLTPVTTVAVTDPGGKVAKRAFDTLNGHRLIADTDVLGNTTSYGYDVGGFVSVVYDPLGNKTETGRDARGNTIRTTTCGHYGGEFGDNCQTNTYKYWPDPAPATLTPDPRNDQLVEITAPRASLSFAEPRTTFEYDTAGNRVRMTSPPVPGSGPRTTTMTYTASTTAAVGGGFTPAGLPMAMTSPGGKQQKTDYNAAGDAARVTDAAGLVTEFKHDGLGRTIEKKVISTAFPAGQVTTFRYDDDGQLVETTEPAVTNRVTGAVHTLKTADVFDADGNVTSRTLSDTTGGDAPRVATSTYDQYGRMGKSVDPTGAVTLYGYDAYGRQSRVISCDSDPGSGEPCPAGDALRTLAHQFDAEGQLLTTVLTGKDGTSKRLTYNAYYADGSLASETDAMNWTTKYTYYNNGKLKKVVRTDGVKTYVVEENSYDAAGNLWSRTENNGATHTNFTFDNAGRMHGSMVSIDGVERATNYVYDADDRVVTVRATTGEASTALRTQSYTYDPMGRPTSESISTQAASGPVGWWKLDESSDEAWAADSSASHHHAHGGYGVAFGNGYATFNGGVLDAFNVLNTTQSYSVSAWVKLNTLTGFHTAVGQGGQNAAAFYLQYSPGHGKWVFISPSSDSGAPSTFYAAASANAPTVNAWAHLVGVFDANTKTMALYVNNSRGTDATNPTPWSSSGSLNIGGASAASGFINGFDGAVDNVQVYQRALTATDVASLWAGGNGRTADVTATTNQLTTNYTVDNRGVTTAMVDPNGNTTNYEHDEVGRLVRTIAPTMTAEAFGGPAVSLRPTVQVGYNAFGDVVEQQDPLGNVTQVRVDAGGRPWKTILPDYTPPGGAPIVGANTTAVYDKIGQVTSVTDRRGKATLYEYDALGNRTKVTGPTAKVTTAEYDDIGQLTKTVDPTGAESSATYDFLGRKLTTSQKVRQPSTVVNTTLYDYGTGTYGDTADAGPWLRKVTSPDGVTVQMTYNNAGEQLTVKDGAGNITTTEYDGLGRGVKTIRPDQTKTQLVYDAADRVVQQLDLDATNAVLRTQSIGYDGNGNPTSMTDARGTTNTFTYNALGKVTSQVQPISATESITTSFGYDPDGRRTRFTDGRGSQFWTTYNTWGLTESEIEPVTTQYPNVADRTFTAVYDIAGRPTTLQQPGGVRIDNEYDDLNQLRTQTGAGAEVATATRTFDYDDAGRITSLSVPGGSNTLSYDDRGLPLTITGPNDTASFTYTNDGRMASRTDAAGATNYTYDTAGRLKTTANSTTGIAVTVDYNNLSLPAKLTYGANERVRTLTYDPLQRLKTDTLTTGNGATTLASITYGYDANSNETSKVTTGFAGSSSNTYTYDLANRLKSWTSGATVTDYAYDAAGNRTKSGGKTFTYDERNQLKTQNGGTSYTYTARGTLRLTSTSTGVYNTQADAFGQVLSQEAASGTSTYTYDALGRAIQPGFKYTGLGNTLAQDPTTTYTRGPGGELLGEGAGNGAGSVHAWTDQHGDVVGQFTTTGTTLSGSTTYDPLGKVLATTGMVGNLGYQGEWTDALTGRVNMLARWYNTDTGQFDTRDSVAVSPAPDSVRANRFQYGDANPLTTTDPTGHWGWSSVKNAFKSATKAVSNVVSAAATAYNYVASGQAWNDVKSAASWVADKASKAWNAVKDSTVRWAKQKANSVKDSYNSAKKCLSGGVSKCVKQTAKNVAKKAADTVKNTVNAIKQDPWKFIATAAVGLAAAVAVGALCATGIGCLILAGAVAGAMSAGAGYMVDVSRGDQDFSWGGLAGTMIQGGLDGALNAGVDRLTGGLRFPKGGPKAPGRSGDTSPAAAAARPGGAPNRPSSSAPPSRPAASSSGSGASPNGPGKHRAPDRNEGNPKAAGCGGKSMHSFDPATLVLMADGTTKPIKDVAVGDQVATTDPHTGDDSAQPVTQLHENVDRELTDVTVVDGGSGASSVLKTTQNHPFWDVTDQRWVEAGQLQPGHRLLVHDDKRLEGDGTGAGVGGGGPGTEVVVVKVDNHVGATTMRDLTVATIHTYYVLAGNTPVLVHNNDDCSINVTKSESEVEIVHADGGIGQGTLDADGVLELGVQTQWKDQETGVEHKRTSDHGCDYGSLRRSSQRNKGALGIRYESRHV